MPFAAVSLIVAMPGFAVMRVGLEVEVAGLDGDGLGGGALRRDVGLRAAVTAAAAAGGERDRGEHDEPEAARRRDGDGSLDGDGRMHPLRLVAGDGAVDGVRAGREIDLARLAATGVGGEQEAVELRIVERQGVAGGAASS